MNRRSIFIIGYISAGILLAVWLRPQLFIKPLVNGSSKATVSSGTIAFQHSTLTVFNNGSYTGDLPLKKLKANGDFGLGVPHMIDGELTLFEGKAYQSTSYGFTKEIPDTARTPFATATTFKAERKFRIVSNTDLKDLLATLTINLPNKNKIYALKVSGKFLRVMTSVSRRMGEGAFKPLLKIQSKKKRIEWQNISGVMLGFYFPEYLSGFNTAGFHFHFLSDDLKSGGHIVSVEGKNLNIEFEEIDLLSVNKP